MNIQEIDLDKNLIIPIPENFTKKELAEISALYTGYENLIQDYKTNIFEGSQEDFDILIKDKKYGINLWIIEILKIDEKNYKITYQTLEEVINPISIEEWGIKQVIKHIGEYMRQAIVQTMTKEEAIKLNDKKTEVEGLLTSFDNIKAF